MKRDWADIISFYAIVIGASLLCIISVGSAFVSTRNPAEEICNAKGEE